MGGSSSRAEAPPYRPPGVYVSSGGGYPGGPTAPGPVGGDNGMRVICPRCRSVLMPPAPLFRCPCGQLMTFQAPPGLGPGQVGDPLGMAGLGGMPGGGQAVLLAGGPGGPFIIQRSGPRMRPFDLEDRLRMLLTRLPPGDPHAVFVEQLLRRIPRRADGSIDHGALERLAGQIDAELHGAPAGLIDLLPTRTFHASSLPRAEDRKEEHVQCMVCLSEYEEGETLRTLPCLHSYHKDCIDAWLKGKKGCPMCRIPIDADVDAMTAEQDAAAEAAAMAKGSSRAAGPAGTGSGAAAPSAGGDASAGAGSAAASLAGQPRPGAGGGAASGGSGWNGQGPAMAGLRM